MENEIKKVELDDMREGENIYAWGIRKIREIVAWHKAQMRRLIKQAEEEKIKKLQDDLNNS